MDGATFQIGQPPARIDILQQIDGITFDEAWKNRIEGLIDGQIQAAVIAEFCCTLSKRPMLAIGSGESGSVTSKRRDASVRSHISREIVF